MKIFCIGRNYVEHAKELNNKVPKQPLVFMKPPTALTFDRDISIPHFTQDLHFELELALLISKEGKNIAENDASDYFSDIGLGIDYTARDVQSACKAKGHPWEISKAFDKSASLSNFFPKLNFELDKIHFQLKKNNKVVQDGFSSDMIFKFDRLIAHISTYFTMEVGDVILTGTPAGVGPLAQGDKLQGYLNGELVLENYIITY